MIFLSTTPLVTNPVLIFFIVLAIILLAPVILNRFKIPHIIGLIVAGIVVGPYGFHVLAYDMSFELFGKVGLLYLMFLAGIEIDMYHLKLNFKRGLVFGVLTFMLPMIIGTLASVYLLGMEWVTSLLLASMYASHTLISYPVVARFGISKNPAVMIAIVGTIIAVIGALLVLAAAVNVHHTGVFNVSDLLWLLGRLVIYCTVMMIVYPRVTRWFFKNFSDKVTQFVYIMALVFLASWFAQAIGLEAVLGAFFGGLVLNRFIPNTSPLMSRIEFVGNAIFIPYFLIGVGMMINVRVIANWDTIVVALNMITVAIVAKWLASWLAQKIYHMCGDERKVLFGLTTAHTAVALAVVTIGYNLHLMDETVLNGTVLMILVTCAIAPIVTSSAAARIKIKMLEEGESKADVSRRQLDTNTLIPVATPMAAQPLVELALLMRGVTGNQNIYALHVRNDNSSKSRALGRSSLEQAQKAAASVDASITTIERYDMSTPIGILNTIEERDITDVILGMHRKSLVIDSFFGPKIEHLLKTTNKMLLISRCYVPLNTITRIVVSVPPKAQYETGFRRWVVKIGNLAREIGCRLIFCCHPETRPLIRGVLHSERLEIRNEYRDVEQWDDFVLLANRILDDDLLVVVSARRTSVSFSADMDSIPGFVQRYFAHNNLIVLYPEQFGEEDKLTTFVDPLSTDMNLAPLSIWMRISEWYRSVVTNRRNKKNIDL